MFLLGLVGGKSGGTFRYTGQNNNYYPHGWVTCIKNRHHFFWLIKEIIYIKCKIVIQQQRPPQRTGNIIFPFIVCTTTKITTNEWKHNFSNGLCPQNLPINMHQQMPQTNSKQSCNLKKPNLKGSLQIRDKFLQRFHTINATKHSSRLIGKL